MNTKLFKKDFIILLVILLFLGVSFILGQQKVDAQAVADIPTASCSVSPNPLLNGDNPGITLTSNAPVCQLSPCPPVLPVYNCFVYNDGVLFKQGTFGSGTFYPGAQTRVGEHQASVKCINPSGVSTGLNYCNYTVSATPFVPPVVSPPVTPPVTPPGAQCSVSDVTTSSNEFYYRSGQFCESGGYQGCRYSLGFDTYTPPNGNKFLFMSTGYDLNVYKVTSADTPPKLVQQTVFDFAKRYSSISDVVHKFSVDPATGYGIAGYMQLVSTLPFPSWIFRADANTGVVTKLLEFGSKGIALESLPSDEKIGISGMTFWGGGAFSLPDKNGMRIPFFGYNEVIETGRNLSTNLFRIYQYNPTSNTLSKVADLDVEMQVFDVIRNTNSATIVGLEGYGTGRKKLRVFKITLNSNNTIQVSAFPSVVPKLNANQYFSSIAVDEQKSLVIVGSSGVKSALEAWDIASSDAPVYLGGISMTNGNQVTTVATGGGWVIAKNATKEGSDNLLFSFADPVHPIEVKPAPYFPEQNPPKYNTNKSTYKFPLFYGALISDPAGAWAFAGAHKDFGSWTKIRASGGASCDTGCSGVNKYNTFTGVFCIPGCEDRTSGFSTTTGLSCGTSVTKPILPPLPPEIDPSCPGGKSYMTSIGKLCVDSSGAVTTTTWVGSEGNPVPPPENNSTAQVRYNLGLVTLKQGDEGDAVKELQKFLNARLHLGLLEDGKLGPKTVAGIKQWQSENGLVADGIVGPKTREKMNIEIN